jgi:hypothetical protein
MVRAGVSAFEAKTDLRWAPQNFAHSGDWEAFNLVASGLDY